MKNFTSLNKTYNNKMNFIITVYTISEQQIWYINFQTHDSMLIVLKAYR